MIFIGFDPACKSSSVVCEIVGDKINILSSSERVFFEIKHYKPLDLRNKTRKIYNAFIELSF